MKRHINLISILIFSSASHATENISINIEAEGNLSQSKEIGCVEISELSNQNNPVDIFIGLEKCMKSKDYQKAADLYLIGMSYGYFDTKRVADKTAHQAIVVLRKNVLGGYLQESLEQLQEAIKNINYDSLCATVGILGKPEYHPTYMIQHGMGAFTGQSTKDGMVENFNDESAWSETLSKIAKCGKQD